MQQKALSYPATFAAGLCNCNILEEKINSSTSEKAKLNGNYKFNAHVVEFKPRVCEINFHSFDCFSFLCLITY